jgi:hypothetical protein
MNLCVPKKYQICVYSIECVYIFLGKGIRYWLLMFFLHGACYGSSQNAEIARLWCY